MRPYYLDHERRNRPHSPVSVVLDVGTEPPHSRMAWPGVPVIPVIPGMAVLGMGAAA